MLRVDQLKPGLVKLSGRFDASQADVAVEKLSSLTESVTVDCSELEYISSVGIGLLVQTYRRLDEVGHTLRLADVTPRIRNIFIYAGLAELLGIE